MSALGSVRAAILSFVSQHNKPPRAIVLGLENYAEILSDPFSPPFVYPVSHKGKAAKIDGVPLWLVVPPGFIILDEKDYESALDNSRVIYRGAAT